MDKKAWKILSIVFSILTLVLVFLVILLPILIKNKAINDSKDKSLPKKDNIELWAKFPGKLQSSTVHTLNILEYTNDLKNISLKNSISLNEETEYDNFDFKEKKVYFDAKSKYKLEKKIQKNNENDINTINTLNLGMFETLETLSNPPLYQQGINSIFYLFKKAFQSPESFIRHIFSLYFFETYIKYEDKVKNNILNNVNETKVQKILSDDEKYAKYSFKFAYGFYQWIKILGEPEKIREASWLVNLFELTSEEIDSILGFDKYLYMEYIQFNKHLANRYNCIDANFCGNELIYTQLITGKVLTDIDIEGLISLYRGINEEFYPFSKSPELYLYFEDYKKTLNDKNLDYKDYIINEKTLENLLDQNSPLSLLNSNNSVLFLSLINTHNYLKISELYNLSMNQTLFLFSYLYEFLPKLFIREEFNDQNGNIIQISSNAKALSDITQNILEKTYYKLSHTKNIYNLVLSKYIWTKLHITLFNLSMEYDDEDICPLLMQQALDDGRKVLKICSDPVTAFDTPYGFSKWFEPYFCLKSGSEEKCNMTLINHLKSIVYITEEEIKSIYSLGNLGQYIEDGDKEIRNAYGCGEICDNDYLAKRQFGESLVSLNTPVGVPKAYTMNELFPGEFPYALELPFFAKKLDYKDPILEEDVEYLVSLSPNKEKNLLDEENYEAFNNKIKFEKEYTLYRNGSKVIDNKSKYDLIDLLNNGFLFNNQLNNIYNNVDNLLQGNNVEDKIYLEFLSSGDYWNNFKPNKNKTTGFNFNLNFENGTEEEEMENDRYGISTEEGKNLRKIININNYPFLNVKKSEYNFITNNYTEIAIPIFNFQTLEGEKNFIDGFQYNHDENTIYYYDKISSRPYKFIYSKNVDYGDQTCRKYVLDKNLVDGINEKDESNYNKASISQKLNKPFIVTIGKEELEGFNLNANLDISTDNYICVETFSNMVLESEINFVYSLFTKNYGDIVFKIENDKIYPIFTYNRNYKVNIDAFNDYFDEINSYKSFRKIFIIIGVIFIVLFAIVACFSIYKFCFYRRPRFSLEQLPKDQLISDFDTKGPTSSKMEEE